MKHLPWLLTGFCALRHWLATNSSNYQLLGAKNRSIEKGSTVTSFTIEGDVIGPKISLFHFRARWIKPDFLVHIPGQMTNLLIVEIKPKNADYTKMAEDLVKLTHFRRDLKDKDNNPANYYEAYFWVYWLPIADWPQLRSKIKKASDGKDVDYSLIKCFIHEQAGTKASQVDW